MGKIKSFDLKEKSWFGSDVAEYHVDKCIGRGWEAEVYQVTEGYSNGQRALKIFDSSELSEELFSNYAYKLEQLTQANVPGMVRFYHAGYHNNLDSWFLITSQANGVELKTYENRLNIFQAVKVLRNILLTLKMSHQASVCIGDLHGENVLVDYDFSTTVIDLDMALEFSESGKVEDISQAVEMFYQVCKDKVPVELRRIVPVKESEIINTSAVQILSTLTEQISGSIF